MAEHRHIHRVHITRDRVRILEECVALTTAYELLLRERLQLMRELQLVGFARNGQYYELALAGLEAELMGCEIAADIVADKQRHIQDLAVYEQSLLEHHVNLRGREAANLRARRVMDDVCRVRGISW